MTARPLTVREMADKLFAMPKEPKHWLLNGYPCKADNEVWLLLDWSKAWLDMGPSVAGNPGPYWHVPVRTGRDKAAQYWKGTAHRLYPRGRLANKARKLRDAEIDAWFGHPASP